jgi:uncharacterized protein (DUF2235 family)
VCCDGTWNTAEQNDGGIPTPTNVLRLYNAVAAQDGSGNTQQRYYHPGVGTDPGLLSRIAGGGLGLDRNIMSAYRSVCDRYSDGSASSACGTRSARSASRTISVCST